MTPRQRELLEYIVSYQAAHEGVSPTWREICAAFNLSMSAISGHLWRLHDIGVIRLVKGRKRLIEVAFPELVGRRDLYDQVWADLAAAGMHRTGSLQTMMSTDGPLQKRTTEIGDRFLKFIESPF